MKKLKFLGFPFFVLLSSCSYHIGTIGGGTGTVTSDQFASIDFAYGTAKTTKFLGIGGNKKDALVLEAKRNLYLNYKLRPTQVIGQTTVDFKRTFFFPILTTKVTVSAEIIDFSTDSASSTETNDNRNRFINPKKSGQLEIGEEVFYSKNLNTRFSATILDYQNENYIIKYIDKNNNLRITKAIPPSLESQNPKIQTPINISQPEKLYTPQNPKGKLVRFRYKEEEYEGELIETSGTSYLIKMEKGNGEGIGLYISEKDIIK
ncbi:DUF6567 family protein [Marinoscillum sp. MHG1-6]|uniref:DUF6567 family protein n=1 Tax=Marinoscillum sp. MHG1-6 TaxID=2959627 RepID=UPI002157C2DA|nr:DUF6567 family protein [Marinoscillum sp. MHG1-6]